MAPPLLLFGPFEATELLVAWGVATLVLWGSPLVLLALWLHRRRRRRTGRIRP